MKRVLAIAFTLVLFSSCVKTTDRVEEPCDCPGAPCVYRAIELFSTSGEICSTGASVKEYEWDNKKVYVFDPGICIADGQSRVQDAECKVLGYLGGIAGNSKIEGKEFNSAVLKRTLWQN